MRIGRSMVELPTHLHHLRLDCYLKGSLVWVLFHLCKDLSFVQRSSPKKSLWTIVHVLCGLITQSQFWLGSFLQILTFELTPGGTVRGILSHFQVRKCCSQLILAVNRRISVILYLKKMMTAYNKWLHLSVCLFCGLLLVLSCFESWEFSEGMLPAWSLTFHCNRTL